MFGQRYAVVMSLCLGTALLAGCGGGSSDTGSTAASTPPASTSSTTSARTSTAAPASSTSATSRRSATSTVSPSSTTTSRRATSTPKTPIRHTSSTPRPPRTTAALAGAGTKCGAIVLSTTGATTPVIVLRGQVACPTAKRVAEGYSTAISAGKAQGQGLYATVQGWNCSWPYVAGRSHANSYLMCADPKGNQFKIGT